MNPTEEEMESIVDDVEHLLDESSNLDKDEFIDRLNLSLQQRRS